MSNLIKKPRVLIVDDEERNVKLFTALCESLGYETLSASNGHEAVEKALKSQPDLILMDVMMPEMNGFDATERIKNLQLSKHIPIVIVTSLDSRADRITGIAKGADDFLSKPIDSEEVILRIKNNLKIKSYHDLLKNYNTVLKKDVEEKTVELQKSLEKLDMAHKKIRSNYIETIQKLTNASEYKDNETGAHIKRVGYYARLIAEKLGMGSEFIESIFYASPMHDIGKVSIPDHILLKPEKHTPEEWEIMKNHTVIGADILKGSESPFLKAAAEIALTHHERWDGSGYPCGLKGEDIPLSGRIMIIVDQYDALRSIRPYKKAFDHEKTVKIITEGDNRTLPEHFDPAVLEAFKQSSDEFYDIFDTHQDQPQLLYS